MWIIGIIYAILASIFGALGDVLVRLSFIKEKNFPEQERRPLYLRPIWIIGIFSAVILNVILSFASLRYASANIITPFAGLHIFWAFLFGQIFLKENINKFHIYGAICVIFGLILVLLFGIHDIQEFNIFQLIYMYSQPSFIFCSITSSILLVIFIYIALFGIVGDWKTISYDESEGDMISNSPDNLSYLDTTNANNTVNIDKLSSNEINNKLEKYSSVIEKHNNDFLEILGNSNLKSGVDKHLNGTSCLVNNDNSEIAANVLNIYSTIKYPKEKNYIKSLYLNISNKKEVIISMIPRVYISSPIIRFCVCATSGLCGGYSNILIQNLMQIMATHSYGVFNYPALYIISTTFFILALLQAIFWNLSLSNYEAIYAVPIVNSVLITSGGLCSLALYNEDLNTGSTMLSPIDGLCFMIGAIFIIFGIFILSFSGKNHSKCEDKDIITLDHIEIGIDNSDELKIQNNIEKMENIFTDKLDNKRMFFLKSVTFPSISKDQIATIYSRISNKLFNKQNSEMMKYGLKYSSTKYNQNNDQSANLNEIDHETIDIDRDHEKNILSNNIINKDSDNMYNDILEYECEIYNCDDISTTSYSKVTYIHDYSQKKIKSMARSLSKLFEKSLISYKYKNNTNDINGDRMQDLNNILHVNNQTIFCNNNYKPSAIDEELNISQHTSKVWEVGSSPQIFTLDNGEHDNVDNEGREYFETLVSKNVTSEIELKELHKDNTETLEVTNIGKYMDEGTQEISIKGSLDNQTGIYKSKS
ncbi:uncharacterized protein CMU_027880 [Cryptosporidium muris RN66]|uniref:Magnesium transporter NIPA family protein n=1 Tax=Cryptosporidium muris (strain RN66) TaxID=441375 RepID=B6ABM6_CRYMR|nr:uncharacterized protein CMU_027880 [Cryptosporidium muris RN66]EEA05778.1 hypothetical protein, conserved [Cryptosporidium muris RN66]|eukprot:XP_002140127.1 hypothetical protein [Cryptosporidium muris RN66]